MLIFAFKSNSETMMIQTTILLLLVAAFLVGLHIGRKIQNGHHERKALGRYTSGEIRQAMKLVLPSWFGTYKPYNADRVIERIIEELKRNEQL